VTGIIEPEIETNVPVVVTVNVSVADVRVTADSELVEVRLVDPFIGTDAVFDKDDTAGPVVVEDTTVVLPETDGPVPGIELVVRGIINELLELEIDVSGVSDETDVSDTEIEKEADDPGTPLVEVEVRKELLSNGVDGVSDEIEPVLVLGDGVMEDVVAEIGVNEYPPVLLILVDTSVVLVS